ncbi:MAG: Com family DNA-binding transcriptional regulator [Rhodoferax sp.]|nr:Com family DNA-binding transcriptional regulator [Rhodoferax sp.]
MAEFVRLQIKCPRCGTLNDMRALSPQPERPGASTTKVCDDASKKSPGLAGWKKPPG